MSNSEKEILDSLSNINELSNSSKRTQELIKLLPDLKTSKSIDYALKMIKGIKNPGACALALSKLSSDLNDTQILEALTIASKINLSASRAKALEQLSSLVEPHLEIEVIERAEELISNEKYTAGTDILVAVVPNCSPASLSRILQVSDDIDDDDDKRSRTRELNELENNLQQQNNQSETSDLPDNFARRRAVENERIDRGFCSTPRLRAKLLSLLFYYFEGRRKLQILEKLLATVDEVPAKPCKTRTLLALASSLPESQARIVLKRALHYLAEIVQDVENSIQDLTNFDAFFSDSDDSGISKFKRLEKNLPTLQIPNAGNEISSILHVLETFLFRDERWWKPKMVEGVPPSPFPQPQDVLTGINTSDIESVEIAQSVGSIQDSSVVGVSIEDMGGLLGPDRSDTASSPTVERGGLLDDSDSWREDDFELYEIGVGVGIGASLGGSLGAPESQPPMPLPESYTSKEPAPLEKRYLNAGIKGRDRDEPLVVDETYLLDFGVDVEKGDSFSTRIPGNEVLFQNSEENIELTIQLDGDDFDIAPQTRTLALPRYGASKKISFAITPKQKRRSTLTATVHKDGNFILEMEMIFPVGAEDAQGATKSVRGRLGAEQYLKPRELGLRFKPVVEGYECTIWGAIANQVVLPLTSVEIKALINRVRKTMMDIVTYTDSNNANIFQTSVDIDSTSNAIALKQLAFAGAELFQGLFYGPKAGADVMNVGDYLKRLAMKEDPVKLQIVAENFPVPWGLLYFGETRGGAKLDWNNFLGMKHIIEQIPRQATMLVDDYAITSNNPSLSVSLNVNTDIDKQMNFDGVARQVQDWAQRSTSLEGAINVIQRQTKDELLKALRELSNDQLMYFYCHANTSSPDSNNSRDPWESSYIQLVNHERITLSDLNREAPMRETLPGNPLIFLNACESAEISPEFYDGFVPYFMAKGARGVIGTECKMPALFATEWAMLFFPRFLSGMPIGELVLELRQEFCKQHSNPLGLLYTVYCNGDTFIYPGLGVADDKDALDEFGDTLSELFLF